MRGLRWIRLAAFALVLLLTAPAAEPQGTIVQITRPCRCYTTAGQPADGRTHSFNFSEVRQINPSPYLNPHAPPPQQPGVTR
jgi:hypothetical protein